MLLLNTQLVIMRFLSRTSMTVTYSRVTKFIAIFVCDCNPTQDLPAGKYKREHGKRDQLNTQSQTQNYLFKIKGHIQSGQDSLLSHHRDIYTVSCSHSCKRHPASHQRRCFLERNQTSIIISFYLYKALLAMDIIHALKNAPEQTPS